MAWENETSGWVKIKEGDIKEFTINAITEKEPNGKIQPIPNKSYYYEFDTDIGTLTVNNLGLFYALTQSQVREGDRIRVNYIKKGTLGKPSEFAIDIITKGDKDDNAEPPVADEDSFDVGSEGIGD